MKHVLLITVFLVALTTKLFAQDQKAIQINHWSKAQHDTTLPAHEEPNQFEIVAKEDVDVNLKFSLKKEGKVNIVVTDQSNRVILTKQFKKEGDNRLAFTMSQNEKYLVKLAGENQAGLVVQVSEN